MLLSCDIFTRQNITFCKVEFKSILTISGQLRHYIFQVKIGRVGTPILNHFSISFVTFFQCFPINDKVIINFNYWFFKILDPVYDEEYATPRETEKYEEYTGILWELITKNFTRFNCAKRCKAPSGFFNGQPWLFDEDSIINKVRFKQKILSFYTIS